jgi:hypothetical protein
MNLMRIIGNAIAALLLGGMLVLSAFPAQAAPLPSVYSQGWLQHSARPAWIRLGAGGSVMAHTWSWNTWNATTAKSAGTLWVNGCKPDCARGRFSYHKVSVTLTTVKKHGAVPYFLKMTWSTPGYKLPGSGSSTATLFYVVLHGASIPGWASCFPLSSKKTCYEPGQFCPAGDRGMTGLAGDGKNVVCRNVNGWRWEPVS